MESVITKRTEVILILSKLSGVGRVTLNKMMHDYQAGHIDLFTRSTWFDVYNPISKAIHNVNEAKREADKDIKAAADDATRILSPMDEDYPKLLAETRDRPALIYLKGELRPDLTPICIIGTREPTEAGLTTTTRISSFYALSSCSIVSGLAVGVDSAAHQACLAQGGHTIAVVAHGLDSLYPPKNKALATNILASGGAIVSEYPYGTKVFKPHFVQRDRIQAGLSQAVILIQMAVKDGSLHAGQAIVRYGRTLAYPIPAREDVQRGEESIQGILKLHQGSAEEQASYLKSDEASLKDKLVTLRSKDDLSRLLARLRPAPISM